MNILTCERVTILLPLYIEEKTSEIENFEIEKHLTECPECMEKYTALKAVAKKIKSAFDSIENQHFEKTQKFFKENLCAYLDNELDNEDYYAMTKIIIENKEAEQEAKEMSDFDRNFQKSIEENKQTLNDFSGEIVKKIKKFSPDYIYKLYVKAAVVTIIFIGLTLLIGYFSSQNYFDDFQKLTDFSFSSLKY